MEHRIIEIIQNTELYQTYEQAFTEATGLPLRLMAAGEVMTECGWQHRNRLCELLAKYDKTCSACLQAGQNMIHAEDAGHHTSTCFAGLCESCVPVQAAGKIMGYLLTGEVATEKPTAARFARIARQLRDWGVDFDETMLRKTYQSTQVMSHKHYRSILELLSTFAEHLSLIAEQLVIRHDNSESPAIHRAREYIRDHLSEPFDLKQVAGRANLSSCYFCKKFKESTGLTFTNYVARTRVDAAKKLLVNPQARISEVAFEVGFQSLTHFNRVFKEVCGESPTQFRENLPDPGLVSRPRYAVNG